MGRRAQRFGIACRFAPDRKDEFASRVVVSHHDVHLLEGLVATQLGSPLDRFQIQRGVGITDPVLAARIIEPYSRMS